MIAIILLVAAIHIPVLLLPGPDSALVVSSALLSRRQALLNTLGIVAGSVILVALSVTGLGIFIASVPVIFNTLKIIGAGYLLWRCFVLLRKESTRRHKKSTEYHSTNSLTSGFFTELSNPKAIMFYIGVFTLVHTYDAHLVLLAGVEIILLTAVYYVILSFIVSRLKPQKLKAGYRFTIKIIVAIVFFVTAALLLLSI